MEAEGMIWTENGRRVELSNGMRMVLFHRGTMIMDLLLKKWDKKAKKRDLDTGRCWMYPVFWGAYEGNNRRHQEANRPRRMNMDHAKKEKCGPKKHRDENWRWNEISWLDRKIGEIYRNFTMIHHHQFDTYFSKSGAKSVALLSLENPVTYKVFFGIGKLESLSIENCEKFTKWRRVLTILRLRQYGIRIIVIVRIGLHI